MKEERMESGGYINKERRWDRDEKEGEEIVDIQ